MTLQVGIALREHQFWSLWGVRLRGCRDQGGQAGITGLLVSFRSHSFQLAHDLRLELLIHSPNNMIETLGVGHL